MANLSSKIGPSGILTGISGESIKDLSDVYSSMSPTNGQALIYNTTNGWQAGNVTSSYVIKTANYTASVGETVVTDTSGSAWTLSLPASPSAGAWIRIIQKAGWSTNPLTISGNGQSLGGIASSTPVTSGSVIEFYYDGANWQNFSFTASELAYSVAVELLVVSGGGGGGTLYSSLYKGGGGGAGGLYYNSAYIVSTSGSYSVTVGAAVAVNTFGNSSTFGSTTIIGGGKGGSGGGQNGFDGACGGGGGGYSGTYPGGIGSVGYNGGTAKTGNQYGGGGGGMGAVGGDTPTGAGGAGVSNSITGTAVTYCTGGGGAQTGGTSPTANTGNGGNGHTSSASGVVILAIPDGISIPAVSGVTYTTDTSSRSGYTVIKMTSGTGTVVWS